MNENDIRNQLDILKHIENLAEGINTKMSKKSGSILKRYPFTFALIALFGVVAISEGLKGILEEMSLFQNSPYLLLIFGLVILSVLGLLYKKLDK